MNQNQWTLTNTVYYIYDGMTVLQERDGNNNPLVSYTRGTDLSGTAQGAGGIGGLLARTDTKGSSFYHADGNGNVMMLVNGTGTVLAKYLYDSYGNTVGSWGTLANANTYRFSSKEVDLKSGLYYYGYRYYDPELGRFIQADTEIPDLSNPQSYNRYSYCVNDPLRYTDPTGHGPVDDALFNTETLKSSYQLMTMHDTGWNKAWEIPVGVIGMAAGTADAAFNVASLGGKGVVEGGAKELVKTGVEELGKTEGEKAGAQVIKDVPNPIWEEGRTRVSSESR